jgi:Flp pilus assembly pilin Flp
MSTHPSVASPAHGAVDLARQRRGQGLVEYSLIVLMIAIVCIAALAAFGTGRVNLWQIASNALPW